MTIKKIIEAADLAKPNDFGSELKIQWIGELDGKIAADVFLMGYSELGQFQYTYPEDLNKDPLVSFPHDDIYRLWLMAKIDLANGEYNRYQNTMIAYNESYGNFVRWFARVWRPAQGGGGYQIRDDVPQYYITAYGLAVRAGFTGTLEEWFLSLKGDPGKSPYEYAKEIGYTGTEEEFAQALLSVNMAMDAAQAAKDASDKAKAAAATFETDPSLSAAGKAADAKATGDRLKALEKPVAPLPIEKGGTGAATAEDALALLGAVSDTLVQERFSITDAGMTLDETIDHVYSNMVNNTNKIIFVHRDTTNAVRFSLGGGTNWMLLITRATEMWGNMIAWQYGARHTIIKTRVLYEGRWLDWAEHKPSIKFADWPVLWKNYSPGSSFAAQHITLNDGYAFKTIAIQFQHSTYYGHSSFYVFAHYSGCQIYPKAVLGDHRLDKTHRYFNRIDLNTISFQKGYRNDSEDNTAAIPVAVYGVEY